MKKSSELNAIIGDLVRQKDQLCEIEQDPDLIRLNRIKGLEKPDYNLTGRFLVGFGITLVVSFFATLLLSYIAVDFGIGFLTTFYFALGVVALTLDGVFVVQLASIITLSLTWAIEVGLFCIIYGIYRGSKAYIEQLQSALLDTQIYIASVKADFDSRSNDDHQY